MYLDNLRDFSTKRFSRHSCNVSWSSGNAEVVWNIYVRSQLRHYLKLSFCINETKERDLSQSVQCGQFSLGTERHLWAPNQQFSGGDVTVQGTCTRSHSPHTRTQRHQTLRTFSHSTEYILLFVLLHRPLITRISQILINRCPHLRLTMHYPFRFIPAIDLFLFRRLIYCDFLYRVSLRSSKKENTLNTF